MDGKRRFRDRSSLKIGALLLLILALAAPSALWFGGARQQRLALAAIRDYDTSAVIRYENDRIIGLGAVEIVTPGPRSWDWWIPRFIFARLDRDSLDGVFLVSFGQGTPASSSARQGNILDRVALLRNLGELICYFPVTDDDLGPILSLRSLTRLEFRVPCPGLTDRSLKMLAKMPSLKELRIDEAPITDAGLDELTRLPKLQSLSLGRAAATVKSGLLVTEQGLNGLGRLTQLQSLRLHSPAISRKLVIQIGGMKKLRTLILDGGSYLDEDLISFKSFANLNSLELKCSSIEGSFLSHLSGLTNLQSVILKSPMLTDESLESLKGFQALQTARIYGPKLAYTSFTRVITRSNAANSSSGSYVLDIETDPSKADLVAVGKMNEPSRS